MILSLFCRSHSQAIIFSICRTLRWLFSSHMTSLFSDLRCHILLLNNLASTLLHTRLGTHSLDTLSQAILNLVTLLQGVKFIPSQVGICQLIYLAAFRYRINFSFTSSEISMYYLYPPNPYLHPCLHISTLSCSNLLPLC